MDESAVVIMTLVYSKLYTVDSFLFVGYQILWILLVKVNHEIKCSTNDKFPVGLYAKFGKTTELNIHEDVSYP